MSFDISPIIKETASLPPIRSGELHAALVDGDGWLLELLYAMSRQSSVELLATPLSLASLDKRLLDEGCPDSLTVSEWKHRRHTRIIDLERIIEAKAQRNSAIVLLNNLVDQRSIDRLLNHTEIMMRLRIAAQRAGVAVFYVAKGQHNSLVQRKWIEQHEASFHSLSVVEEGVAANRWTVKHWFSAGAVLSWKMELSALQTSGHGYQRLTAHSKVNRQHHEANVFCMQDALKSEEQAPAHWVVLDHPHDWRERLSVGSVDTVIFSDNSHSQRYQLLEDVYQIRERFGEGVKILVRETEFLIRHYDQRLLLSAGATYVVPKPLSIEHLNELVHVFEHWRSPHAQPSLQSLLELMIPADVSGYLPPPQFIDSVTRMARIASFQEVQVTLLHGQVAPGIDPKTVIGRFNARRKGDVCTLHKESVYIFLFACGSDEVERTLLSLLGFSIANLFAKEERLSTPFSIRGGIENLDNLINFEPWHDFTEELQQLIPETDSQLEVLRYHPHPVEWLSNEG